MKFEGTNSVGNFSVRSVLLLVFATISIRISSQNLIPNPSFETGNCPLGYTSKQADFHVSSWKMPDSGTPDYYNRCSKKNSGVPFNWAGAREPAAGDAYVGIYLRKGPYQENIGVELKEPLKEGVKYYGSFSIATVANSEYFPCQVSIALTKNPIHIDLTSTFDQRQITFSFPNHDTFMDFSWHTLTFSYVAQGGENHLYIGSLSKEVELCQENIYQVKQEAMLRNAAYVYLDDFYLGEKKDYNEPTPSFKFAPEVDPISLFFDFDTDLLKPRTISKLDSLVSFLNNSSYHLLVTGGTDSIGSDTYNLTLGLQRAESVRRYLAFSGIDPERIGIKSIGEENPIYPNHSDETRSLNRSALIEFYKEISTEN